jgi:hypothetical protein
VSGAGWGGRCACRAGRAVAALAACLALAACDAPRYETNWNRVQTGMTREQVAELLGEPSSRHRPKYSDEERLQAATTGTAVVAERWQYGDTLSSFATGALMPNEADERAWCVFFGPDGTVTDRRTPSWR